MTIDDTNQNQDAHITPVEEPKSDGIEVTGATESVKEASEDVSSSAAQPLSEPGESDQSAQALTSATSDEPMAEGQASLAGEQSDIEQAKNIQHDSVSDNPNSKWYVVHTYSGHENKVASALKQRIESEHLEHKILDILVPTQDKIEIRSGKKEQVKEKIFPGYILVKMILDDTSWLAVRTTPGVTSFVGIGNKPTPISEEEVKGIVKFMSQGATSTFKDIYNVNDTIKIVDGPFSDFIGKVDSVDKEKGKVRVLVSIFGRETPVELDFLQVQKL